MVSRDGGCFACSRVFIVIISVLVVIVGVLGTFSAFGMTVSPEIDKEFRAESPTLLFVLGLSYIAIGGFGFYSAYSLQYWAVFTLAVVSTVAIFLNFFVSVYSFGLIEAIVWVGLGVPMVICAWILVSGIYSKPIH